MDTNVIRDILEIKEQLKNRKSGVDAEDLEKLVRELKTELFIKRDESKQLRRDLEAVNLELQTLRKSLDNAKKSADEHQFNLNILLKKSRSNEEELQEKRESLMKTQLQHQMVKGEVELLKEKLQEAETEKTELCRKIDRLEAKQRHNLLYHNEISKRDKNLRNFMEEMNETVIKLQAEHVQAVELSKKTQLANETLEQIGLLTKENEKLKKEKDEYEEMYIRISAKYEKLEEIMAKDVELHTPGLITKIIFNQWKQNRTHYEGQIKLNDEILCKMNENLSAEKCTNLKLVYENEQVTERNVRLEVENAKLKDICKKNGETIEELNEKVKNLEKRIREVEDITSLNKHDIKEEPIQID